MSAGLCPVYISTCVYNHGIFACLSVCMCALVFCASVCMHMYMNYTSPYPFYDLKKRVNCNKQFFYFLKTPFQSENKNKNNKVIAFQVLVLRAAR